MVDAKRTFLGILVLAMTALGFVIGEEMGHGNSSLNQPYHSPDPVPQPASGTTRTT